MRFMHVYLAKKTEIAERRLNVRLLKFWEEACQQRLMPDEVDLDPDTLTDIWPQCFLLQTFDIHKRGQYTYTYLGDAIIDAFQDGMLDEGQSMMISPHAEKMALSFQQVMETRAPVVSDGEFLTVTGHMLRYHQCLLPLGKGEEVVAIFGGMSFKAY